MNKKIEENIDEILKSLSERSPEKVRKAAVHKVINEMDKYAENRVKVAFKKYFNFMNLRITSNHRLSQTMHAIRNLKGKKTMRMWGKNEGALSYVFGKISHKEYIKIKELLGIKKEETEFDKYK